MSWLFSQALVEDCLPANYLDGEQFAPLNGNPIQQAYCAPDKMTDFSHFSRFGMTFKPLTEDRGEELLTLYLADFHAKRSQQRREAQILQKRICGPQCDEWYNKCNPRLSLLKMSQHRQLNKPQRIYWKMDMKVNTSNSVLPTWVRIIFGTDFGYCHTPTCTANFAAPSMQKHPSCRNFVTVFGRPSPINYEYLMGWPIGWTDLKPLATDKYQLWQQSHSSSYTGPSHADT